MDRRSWHPHIRHPFLRKQRLQFLALKFDLRIQNLRPSVCATSGPVVTEENVIGYHNCLDTTHRIILTFYHSVAQTFCRAGTPKMIVHIPWEP